MLVKNDVFSPKPVGRGIWRDLYALFPGDLEGFCLIVKTNPRGSTPGKANDKCIRSCHNPMTHLFYLNRDQVIRTILGIQSMIEPASPLVGSCNLCIRLIRPDKQAMI